MKDPLGRPPALLLIPAALATALLVVPLAAMVVATDWAGLPEQLRSEPLRQALWLSLTTATTAALVCLVLGLPLAWVLARLDFRFRGVLRALVAVPLVLPPVVAGVALRTTFGRRGLLGEPILEVTGFSFPFTTWGVVLSHVFVSLPFVVIAVEGAFRASGPGVRRRRGDPRGEPLDHLPAGHGPARPPRHHRRGGAGLGAGAG